MKMSKSVLKALFSVFKERFLHITVLSWTAMDFLCFVLLGCGFSLFAGNAEIAGEGFPAAGLR